MFTKTVFVAVAGMLLSLLTASKAQAWGACHVGYTHIGYGGVQHYGRTVGVGPYGGGYSAGRYGSYGAYGGYRAGYGGYGGYHYAGYGGAAYGGYRAGYYRAW
jgi:hypothetical protein